MNVPSNNPNQSYSVNELLATVTDSQDIKTLSSAILNLEFYFKFHKQQLPPAHSNHNHSNNNNDLNSTSQQSTPNSLNPAVTAISGLDSDHISQLLLNSKHRLRKLKAETRLTESVDDFLLTFKSFASSLPFVFSPLPLPLPSTASGPDPHYNYNFNQNNILLGCKNPLFPKLVSLIPKLHLARDNAIMCGSSSSRVMEMFKGSGAQGKIEDFIIFFSPNNKEFLLQQNVFNPYNTSSITNNFNNPNTSNTVNPHTTQTTRTTITTITGTEHHGDDANDSSLFLSSGSLNHDPSKSLSNPPSPSLSISHDNILISSQNNMNHTFIPHNLNSNLILSFSNNHGMNPGNTSNNYNNHNNINPNLQYPVVTPSLHTRAPSQVLEENYIIMNNALLNSNNNNSNGMDNHGLDLNVDPKGISLSEKNSHLDQKISEDIDATYSESKSNTLNSHISNKNNSGQNSNSCTAINNNNQSKNHNFYYSAAGSISNTHNLQNVVNTGTGFDNNNQITGPPDPINNTLGTHSISGSLDPSKTVDSRKASPQNTLSGITNTGGGKSGFSFENDTFREARRQQSIEFEKQALARIQLELLEQELADLDDSDVQNITVTMPTPLGKVQKELEINEVKKNRELKLAAQRFAFEQSVRDEIKSLNQGQASHHQRTNTNQAQFNYYVDNNSSNPPEPTIHANPNTGTAPMDSNHNTNMNLNNPIPSISDLTTVVKSVNPTNDNAVGSTGNNAGAPNPSNTHKNVLDESKSTNSGKSDSVPNSTTESSNSSCCSCTLM